MRYLLGSVGVFGWMDCMDGVLIGIYGVIPQGNLDLAISVSNLADHSPESYFFDDCQSHRSLYAAVVLLKGISHPMFRLRSQEGFGSAQRKIQLKLDQNSFRYLLTMFSNYSHNLIPPRRQSSVQYEPLEAQGLTSSTNNSALDLSRANQSVGVRHRGQSSGLSSVLSITEVVVPCNSIAVISGVERLAGADELVGLNEDLGTVASVDSVADGVEVAVVDVTGTEADGRSAGVDVVPVVVVLGNVEVTCVLVAVVVRVADQRGLPVIVDVGVGHGDVVRCMGDLKSVSIIWSYDPLSVKEPLTSIRPS